MSEFCRKCGATFPHRYGEGRCEECLPRAFNEALADRDEWERLWKKASVAVIDLQDEVEKLKEGRLDFRERIAKLEATNRKLWRHYVALPRVRVRPFDLEGM